MNDTYRVRYCPLCSGVVKCDLRSGLDNKQDRSFTVVFVAKCEHCGLEVRANKSTVFDLFIDSDKIEEHQPVLFEEVDDKWVYATGEYRGLK